MGVLASPFMMLLRSRPQKTTNEACNAHPDWLLIYPSAPPPARIRINTGYAHAVFLLWPLFARAPRHWFLENFLLSAPGVQSVFFLLRSVGRRDLSAGPEQKKKHHPAKKKHHPGCCFFGAFFFALAPCRRPTGLLLPLPFPGAGAKKKHPGWCFFFALAPCRRPTGLLLPLPFAGAAAKKKKKHPGWCFFFCSGPVPAPNGASPSPAFRRGRSKKKNTLGGVFFLLRPRADAHSLTAGLGGDASPSPGWCFFFCCGPARTGVVFFFFAVAPPGRSLTHGGLGRFRQGPGGVFFFAAAPPGLFRQ